MSAAAGGKYKRSRKSASSKKKYTRVTAKAVTSKVLGIAPGRDPFAAMTPRFFKVNLEDTMIYCNAPGTVSNFDSNLAPVPWMNQGAAFADSTGAASALQFGFTIRAMLGDLYNKDEFINLFQSFAIQKMDIRSLRPAVILTEELSSQRCIQRLMTTIPPSGPRNTRSTVTKASRSMLSAWTNRSCGHVIRSLPRSCSSTPSPRVTQLPQVQFGLTQIP